MLGAILYGCPSQQQLSGSADAAQKVYVAPGEYDEFYGFLFGLKYFDERVKGFGFALISWLLLAVLYDGLILLFVSTFSYYPLEKPMILFSVINPIDLARISILLRFDISALMGYTGAVFNRFFGSYAGLLVSISCLLIRIIWPAWRGVYLFNKKDY